MAERLERREDIDGCGCLECRGVRTVAIHRTFGDIALWSVQFFRTSISVVVVFLILVAIQILVQRSPLPRAVALSGVGFVGAMYARGYVTMLVFGELSNQPYTARTATIRTIRRIPAVFATWIITFACILTFGGLAGAVFSTVAFAGVLPEPIASSTAIGSLALVLFSGLSTALFVKFILATEAAVIGGYGPIAAHRVSWQLVSFRHRAPIALFGFLFSFLLFPFLFGNGPTFGSGIVDGAGWSTTLFSLVTTVATIGGYAFSCFLFSHLYVRRILER